MEIKFATPKTIKYIKNTVPLVHVKKPEDHVMGGIGIFTGPEWTVLQPDGQWLNYAPQVELQKNIYGDTYCCISFSLNNIHEFLHKRLYGVEINKSDRFLGVGSGTIRGQGNSKSTVAEWNRTHGFLYESEMPYLPSMSLDEFFAKLSPDDYAKALTRLAEYLFGYKWLKDNSPASIKLGLTFSPVQVDVEQYAFNDKGLIVNSGTGFVHEVTIEGYEPGFIPIIYDSENDQHLRYDPSYNFGSPMIHNLKKTLMTPKIYKQQNSPALYFKHWSQNVLIPIADGVLVGGDLFKTLLGTDNYASIPRVKQNDGQDWVTLPFPIASYSFITK